MSKYRCLYKIKKHSRVFLWYKYGVKYVVYVKKEKEILSRKLHKNDIISVYIRCR